VLPLLGVPDHIQGQGHGMFANHTPVHSIWAATVGLLLSQHYPVLLAVPIGHIAGKLPPFLLGDGNGVSPRGQTFYPLLQPPPVYLC
jgi:hypothetical protein